MFVFFAPCFLFNLYQNLEFGKKKNYLPDRMLLFVDFSRGDVEFEWIVNKSHLKAIFYLTSF